MTKSGNSVRNVYMRERLKSSINENWNNIYISKRRSIENIEVKRSQNTTNVQQRTLKISRQKHFKSL